MSTGRAREWTRRSTATRSRRRRPMSPRCICRSSRVRRRLLPACSPALRIDGALADVAGGRARSLAECRPGARPAERGASGRCPPPICARRTGCKARSTMRSWTPFVFVRPTGTPLSAALGKWAEGQADYAISEWTHFFRGEPRVKNDRDVTAADLAKSNIVLFGDPSSNAIYKRMAKQSPDRLARRRRRRWRSAVRRESRAGLRVPEPAESQEVRGHQQRLHLSRSVEQRHAVAQAGRLGGRRHHQAGEQLSVPAAVRGRAGVLRRTLADPREGTGR